ncbi:MAG TPA: hypothetical protein VK203_18980 [Nostocaceae cyanobacterium]|nr:hypothetical protein [Nostocaceae cyanobacterium]
MMRIDGDRLYTRCKIRRSLPVGFPPSLFGFLEVILAAIVTRVHLS